MSQNRAFSYHQHLSKGRKGDQNNIFNTQSRINLTYRNIPIVLRLLEANRHLTIIEIATGIHCTNDSIQIIITDYLKS